MRISDWSSDVCSSDLDGDRVLASARGPLLYRLRHLGGGERRVVSGDVEGRGGPVDGEGLGGVALAVGVDRHLEGEEENDDRKSVVTGKSVSVRVDRGGCGDIKKQII